MHPACLLAGSKSKNCYSKLITKCLVQQTCLSTISSLQNLSNLDFENLLQGNASFTLIDDILTKVFDLVVASLTRYSAFYTAYMVFFMLC